MRRLWIVRHAKSSWKEPRLSDFDRPLNDRGRRDAPEMGRRLARVGPPDRIVTSSAARALATAHAIAEEVGCELGRIDASDSLYMASSESLLHAVRSFEGSWEAVILIGHNPGLTDFVNLLARCDIANVPTCGVAELELAVNDWGDVQPGGARLVSFDTPKERAD